MMVMILLCIQTYGYYISDFLLDDILTTKLRVVGRLLHWHLDPCELSTFIQILR